MVLQIDAVVPVTARLNESQSLIITGEDFGAGAIVRIGGIEATNVLVNSSNQITCSSPESLEEDIYDIEIEIGAESDILENAFIIVTEYPRYPYADQSYATVQSRILGRMPDTYEKFEGSTIYDFIAPISLDIADIYLSLSTIFDLIFLLTTSGSYVDFKGIEYGVLRRKATRAIGSVTFTGTMATIIESRFQISNTPATSDTPQVFFVTDESVTLADSGGGVFSATVNVTAVERGSEGNLVASALNNIPFPINGLASVTNPSATNSGSDREGHVSYLSRILSQILTPARAGNIANYKQWARQSSQYVGKVGVDPLRKDENAGVNQPGEVGVYILNADGSTPSAALISEVQNFIGPDNEGKGRAPIGARATVAAANFVNVHVRVDITASSGFVESEVISEVQTVIQEFVNNLDIGENVRYHNLGTAITTANGVDSITAFHISTTNTTPGVTENADIAINNTQKATAGTITVS